MSCLHLLNSFSFSAFTFIRSGFCSPPCWSWLVIDCPMFEFSEACDIVDSFLKHSSLKPHSIFFLDSLLPRTLWPLLSLSVQPLSITSSKCPPRLSFLILNLLNRLSHILHGFDCLFCNCDSHICPAHRFSLELQICTSSCFQGHLFPLGCFTGTCNSALSKLILQTSSSSMFPTQWMIPPLAHLLTTKNTVFKHSDVPHIMLEHVHREKMLSKIGPCPCAAYNFVGRADAE